MSVVDSIKSPGGGSAAFTGNEAVVRGALEAGVGFVSGYPGTPASEIGDLFRIVSPALAITYEDSINEKVAIETAFTASLLGVRSLSAMKHLGLAYAGDPMGTIPYVGVSGGMVVVSGGDPGLIVSPNEQDQRYLAEMLRIPVFDPATPQEAYDMTRFAYELSERTSLPVLIRTTIQLNFMRAPVSFGPLPEQKPRKPYRKDPAAHVPIPANARVMRKKLEGRIAAAEKLLAESPFFPLRGGGRLGVITSGVATNYVLDALAEESLESKVKVLEVGAPHPVPASLLGEFLSMVDRVLVVEEFLPFLEDRVKAAALGLGFRGKIEGKRSGTLPLSLALGPDAVREVVSAWVKGRRAAAPGKSSPERKIRREQDPDLPPRPPVLCAGCPHRATYLAVRLVFGDEALYCSDIGCYTLGYGEPLQCADMLLCMGSSITMATAAARLGEKHAVAFIGDSTFFHSGLPALANAAHAGADILVVVMDNGVVAMTGHQPSFSGGQGHGGQAPEGPDPGRSASPREGRGPEDGPQHPAGGARAADPASVAPAGEFGRVRSRGPSAGAAAGLSVEEAARSLGARVWVVDPEDLKATVAALEEARRASGVRVLVARKVCALLRPPGEARKYRVDPEKCRHCAHEGVSLYCSLEVPREYERRMARSRVEVGRAEPMGSHAGAPCSRACPVNICIQGYVGRVAAGDYQGALEVIRKRNPLPVVSSFVCHQPCEKVCVVAGAGEPVAVNRIKEFLVMWERSHKRRRSAFDRKDARTPPPPKGKKVAVIGAGPAGLACAYELTWRGYGVTVFDSHRRPGGMLAQAIPGYRLPRDMLDYELEALLESITFVPGRAFTEAGQVEELFRQGYGAVCLATGAHRPRPLPGWEGEQMLISTATDPPRPLPGWNGEGGGIRVAYALEFLKKVSEGEVEGITGSVLVVGGGDCAVDAARMALRLGASDVTILYRRGMEEMRAHPSQVLAALEEGAKLVCHGAPLKLAERVEVQKMKPGELDGDGRRRPEPVPGATFSLAADLVLLALGEDPAEGGLFCGLGLEVRRDGTVVADGVTGRTAREGVFAAGDAAGAPRTVIDAVASGKRAAFGIDCFLAGPERAMELEFLAPPEAPGAGAAPARPAGGHMEASAPGRAEPPSRKDAQALGPAAPGADGSSALELVRREAPGGYEVIEAGRKSKPRGLERPLASPTEEEARNLAARCLLCGACGECSTCLELFGCPAMYVMEGKVAIDQALCTGCGVCAAFCPNGAIEEVR